MEASFPPAPSGGSATDRPRRPESVQWLRISPYIVLHLACLGVIWVGWSWTALAVALSLYLVRMFAVTGLYHRYFSHRTFRTSRPVQLLFALLGNSALQGGPLWWASQHRHHHRHADREADLHSPKLHGLLWSHMGWLTVPSAFRTREEYVKDLARYPELRWLDRYHYVVPLLLAGGLFFVGAWLDAAAPQLGTSGAQLLVWGFCISTVAVFHATCTINSLAHRFGRRRYDTRDESRNSALLALMTLGEGWHNNHHHFPGSVRQGFYWWEFDVSYYVLLGLSWLGLVWDLKPVPEHVKQRARVDSIRPV